MHRFQLAVCCLAAAGLNAAAADAPLPSYAERLGWAPQDKVVIIHIDDAGMSHASNLGTIQAMESGLATSCSIMMPCSWVPEYAHYLEIHPETDAGLHLTMTSEWTKYRWGPLAGKGQVPGLTDAEGCLWDNVSLVIAHASADEIEKEIRAQLDRAETMGIKPTHLDSHMGTLFATSVYTERYIKVGIEKQIPVLFPGGHLQYISQELPFSVELLKKTAQQIWDGGLPVIDDILAATYDWKAEDKVAKYSQVFREMKPGILEIINHATVPTDEFPVISPSIGTRKADLDAMLSPELKKVAEEEGILFTTWRELKQRRDKIVK